MNIRNTELQRAVLSAVKLAGLVAWIAIAPNTLQLLHKKTRWSTKSAKSATRRLIEKGLLKETKEGLMLTKAGERLVDALPRQRPARWDRKWRIVVFDIPESRKKLRDLLRMKLNAIGFKKLQNSVWVCPYECEELLELLRRDFNLGKEVIYLTADRIERDSELRARFGL